MCSRAINDAERELERLKKDQLQAATGRLTDYARDLGGVTLLTHDAGADADAGAVRTMVMDLRGRLGSERPVVVAVTGAAGGRPVIVVATNELARDRGVKAGDLVRGAAARMSRRRAGAATSRMPETKSRSWSGANERRTDSQKETQRERNARGAEVGRTQQAGAWAWKECIEVMTRGYTVG